MKWCKSVLCVCLVIVVSAVVACFLSLPSLSGAVLVVAMAVTRKYQWGHELDVGSSGSGKSQGKRGKIILAAEARPKMGIVVLDPHPDSLAWNGFVDLTSRGYEKRIVFDDLSTFDKVPQYRFIRRSKARSELQRAAENDQTAKEFLDLVLRRRGMDSAAANPQLEECSLFAILLLVHQPYDRPESDIAFAYQPDHGTFRAMVATCTDPQTKSWFEKVADGTIKRGIYRPAQRLLEGTVGNPVFAARCGTSFDLWEHLRNGGIYIMQGGGMGVSDDALGVCFGAIANLVNRFVRVRPKPWPRIMLVMDEATNCGLITTREMKLLAECRKWNLDMHIMVQQPDFPSTKIRSGVLSNTQIHNWYMCMNPDVQHIAASDLGNPELKNVIGSLPTGHRYVKRRGVVSDEQVKLPRDPWGLPGLAQKKAESALKRIRERSFYRSTTWSQQQLSTIGENDDASLNSGSDDIPATSTTTFQSSPVNRLITER